MKMLPIAACVALAGWIATATCSATSVGTCIVEQPVNLGTKADPAKIPLGGVPVVSNYNYGVHALIGASRPFPDGAMRWKEGSELDQNLASVYGISVEPEDSTQLPGRPVSLRVKPWKPPAYSPYSKEQVLAATLWCLIRSTGSTPEQPLEVFVVTEAPEDKELETKYSGKYVAHRGKDGAEVPPIRIPGTTLEEDARGIAWVYFDDVPRQQEPPPSPAMIITETRGDAEPGWHVFPLWGNGESNTDPLMLGAYSVSMRHSVYPFRGMMEANSFVADGGVEMDRHSFMADGADASVLFITPRVKPETLAAELFALVLATLPTGERPLKVRMEIFEFESSGFGSFRDAPGWTTTPPEREGGKTLLECEFIWSPEENKLTKGSIPLVQMKSLGWIDRKPEEETEKESPAPTLPTPEVKEATIPPQAPETQPQEESEPDAPPAPVTEEENPKTE